MSDHAMMDGGADTQQHDKSGGCASMQGAVCLTMVGVIFPVSTAFRPPAATAGLDASCHRECGLALDLPSPPASQARLTHSPRSVSR